MRGFTMDILKLCNEAMILAERNNDLVLMDLIGKIKDEVVTINQTLKNKQVHTLHLDPDQEEWGHFTSNND